MTATITDLFCGAGGSSLGAEGFYGPTEGEKRRRRNATPWLPPLSCDPRLTSVPMCGGLHERHIIRNGPGGMAFTYDDLRDALVDLGRYVVACNAMHRSQDLVLAELALFAHEHRRMLP